jgi:predicted dehydrogenase
MGKHHCDAVRSAEGLAVVGVFDTDPERRKAAQEEQPGVRVFETYCSMLEDPSIEALVLVTPHHTHAPLSVEASEAGKHVVTEKVMCLNTLEADAMIRAAKTAGKMLTVYQNRRWDGDYLTVRKEIRDGLLGKVFQIESSVNGWWFPAGWRGVKSMGGGMLYDWGAHLADQLVQLMLPAKPVTVFATSHHGVHDVDIETQTTADILFDNGVSAQIDVGCISHLSRPRWLIRGDRGALVMPDWEHCHFKAGVEEREVSVEPSDWAAFYTNVSRHLNHGEPLAINPEDVRIAIAVIEAAFKSAASGKSESVV